MSNKYKNHLQILCEDKINLEIARGFFEQIGFNTNIDYLGVAGGWEKCRDKLKDPNNFRFDDYQFRYLLIIIDFDKKYDIRIQEFYDILKEKKLDDRVFVIGSLVTPEDLKRQLDLGGHNDVVGLELFQDCNGESAQTLWNSDYLKHNRKQIEALKKATGSFINWGK